ncbi:MAG: hypothetical protein FWG41_03065, partial [Methanomassiliicoccaceae archaeon]|nr:hypothetical protein [Methanomassiliicoccaceae archaeon]
MNKSNPKHVIPAVCAAALLLALAAFFIITPAASAAITDNVPYIDENGDTLNHDSVTVLDSPGSIAAVHGSGNTLTAGWYVVVGSFTFSDTIFINGDVHLILSDNCSLTVNGSGTDAGISVTGGDSLTVYGQSVSAATMGSLDATADAVEFFGPSAGVTVISGSGIGGGAGLSCGDITINGGMITATGGFAAACTLTLNATATAITGAGIGGMGGAADGTIRINGGVVIATGGEAQAGTLGTTVLDTPVALSGAGIGGAGSTSGGIIEINGGRIEATAGEVYDFEDSGITYTGGPNSLLGPGAGIGGGADSDGNMIIINDGDIVAVSPPGIRSGSAGIGGGVGGSGGTIIINGGTITATCEAQITAGAGIGGGAHLVGGIVTGGSGGNITITGGTITA